jgi:hypothetical protein
VQSGGGGGTAIRLPSWPAVWEHEGERGFRRLPGGSGDREIERAGHPLGEGRTAPGAPGDHPPGGGGEFRVGGPPIWPEPGRPNPRRPPAPRGPPGRGGRAGNFRGWGAAGPGAVAGPGLLAAPLPSRRGFILSDTWPGAQVLRDGVPQRDASPWAVTAPVWRSCGWWVSGRPAARANRSPRSP